jgi:hypothetical protein
MLFGTALTASLVGAIFLVQRGRKRKTILPPQNQPPTVIPDKNSEFQI